MNKKTLLINLLMLISISSNVFAQTEYKDIAPIFIANCTGCHHAGGLTFPLTSYAAISHLGGPIKYAVENNNMPPWPADPTYRNYHRERVLSVADKTLLINWINNGMLAGDTSLAPPMPNYSGYELNGTPDLVLTLPTYTSSASSSDHYYCINVPTGLLQDRYIKAFEFVPGNAALIHHAVITIDTTGTAVNDMSGGCYNFQGQINIGDFAPGMGPTVLPGVPGAKFGFKLKANSTISFQIHVPSGTSGMKDSSQIRLYFYPTNETGIRDMYFQTVLQNWNFFIPPNSVVTATQKYPTGAAGLPIDISLYGAFPHSHQTCKSIINYAYKTTDTIPLIRINQWDFHWQGQYTFKKMLKVPTGYKLFSAHVFDNTTNNPNTPNPNLPVYPGTGTNDEMLFDSYLYTYYQAGDEHINIDSILSVDPLLTPTSITSINKEINDVIVYPNPMSSSTTFEYSLLSAQKVTIKIYNYLGQEVTTIYSENEQEGKHRFKWTPKREIAKGTYFYKIQAGTSARSGQIIVE